MGFLKNPWHALSSRCRISLSVISIPSAGPGRLRFESNLPTSYYCTPASNHRIKVYLSLFSEHTHCFVASHSSIIWITILFYSIPSSPHFLPSPAKALHQVPSPTQNFSWFTSCHYSIQSNFDICDEFTLSK